MSSSKINIPKPPMKEEKIMLTPSPNIDTKKDIEVLDPAANVTKNNRSKGISKIVFLGICSLNK